MLITCLQRFHFIWIVFLLLVWSILCQIIIGVLYQKLLRETDRMAVTEHRILKQCKLKFTNCYELNDGAVNIPVFVDKFMNQIRFAGITLSHLTHLSGQLMLLSVFAAGLGVCREIIDGAGLRELLPYYIVSLTGLYLYFAAASLADAGSRRSMVRTNLVDYLENHLTKHLQLIQEKELQPFLLKKQPSPEAAQARMGERMQRQEAAQAGMSEQSQTPEAAQAGMGKRAQTQEAAQAGMGERAQAQEAAQAGMGERVKTPEAAQAGMGERAQAQEAAQSDIGGQRQKKGQEERSELEALLREFLESSSA